MRRRARKAKGGRIEMSLSGRYLIVVAAMCGLSAATVGLITNVAGLFFTPMADEFGVLRGSASLTLTIANTCVALGGLATRRLCKLVPLRVLLIAGAAIMALSTLATAFAPSIQVAYLLAVTRGLAGGAIGFVLITSVLNAWFASQLGLVTSIAMGCSGLAGAVFTPLIQPVVASTGWRAGMALVAALQAALCLPAILLVPSLGPAEVGLRPLGEKDAPREAPISHEQSPVHVDKVLAFAVVLYAVLSAAVSAMPQHFPGYAAEVGLTAATGALMISACMVANTLGKVVLGWLTDRVGARISIHAYTIMVSSSIAALLAVHAPAAFVVAAFFFGMCYARATVGLSMMCREVFGRHGLGIVYPLAALGCSISNAVFSAVVGFAFDLTGGYTVSLVGLLAFLVASSVLTQWSYGRASAQAEA